ncbi:unnamed protein product [Tenebrio molitor]|nr:unnamed protein product [Tenebrio molitor]
MKYLISLCLKNNLIHVLDNPIRVKLLRKIKGIFYLLIVFGNTITYVTSTMRSIDIILLSSRFNFLG